MGVVRREASPALRHGELRRQRELLRSDAQEVALPWVTVPQRFLGRLERHPGLDGQRLLAPPQIGEQIHGVLPVLDRQAAPALRRRVGVKLHRQPAIGSGAEGWRAGLKRLQPRLAASARRDRKQEGQPHAQRCAGRVTGGRA